LGGKVILAGVLIVTLFPGILLFLGLLEIVQALNLANNYLALIIPYTAINLPLTILVLQLFRAITKDLKIPLRLMGTTLPNATANLTAHDCSSAGDDWNFTFILPGMSLSSPSRS